MGKLEDLVQVVENLEERGKAFLEAQTTSFDMQDKSYIIQSKNRQLMRALWHGGARFDFIYLDPPFYTLMGHKRKLNLKGEEGSLSLSPQAYPDKWENFKEYLETIGLSLWLARELLTDKGSLCLHVDFRTQAYFRILLDHIFGENRYLNTIIWAYKSGGSPKRYFARKHDSIFIYSKTRDHIFRPQKERSYNRDGKPYRFKGVKEYEDERGRWYTLVQQRDVWHIPMVGRTSRERTGYPTQKPEQLIRRLMVALTDEDSKVADFYAGSGTVGAVAQELGLHYLLCDESSQAITVMEQRLLGEEDVEVLRERPTEENFIKFRKNLGYLKEIPWDTSVLSEEDQEELKTFLKENPEALFHSILHEIHRGGDQWERLYFGEGEQGLAYANKFPLLRGKQRIILQNQLGQRYQQDVIGSDKYEKTN